MVLQSTFSVMNFCMKDFKTGCDTHWNVSTFVACKSCVLCWQAWPNMHVVMPLLFSKVTNLAAFCGIFLLHLIFATANFDRKMLSIEPAMF